MNCFVCNDHNICYQRVLIFCHLAIDLVLIGHYLKRVFFTLLSSYRFTSYIFASCLLCSGYTYFAFAFVITSLFTQGSG